MNSDIKEQALLLHDWIMTQDVVIEYKRYEELIKAHPELKDMEEELKQLQKDIVNAKHQQIDASELINKYKIKKELYEEHPLINNYFLLKQDVNNLLQEISTRININLSKKG